MENENKNKLNEESENDSLTPIRPPVENISAGAGNDDQLEKLNENADKDPVDPEEQVGVSPTAYPGPAKGNADKG